MFWLFLGQGRISLFLAVAYVLQFPSDWSEILLSVTLVSVFIYEFVGLRTYRSLLIDQEEIIPDRTL